MWLSGCCLYTEILQNPPDLPVQQKTEQTRPNRTGPDWTRPGKVGEEGEVGEEGKVEVGQVEKV